MQLLPGTDKVLLNMHPIIFPLQTDALARTTVAVSVEKRKEKKGFLEAAVYLPQS